MKAHDVLWDFVGRLGSSRETWIGVRGGVRGLRVRVKGSPDPSPVLVVGLGISLLGSNPFRPELLTHNLPVD